MCLNKCRILDIPRDSDELAYIAHTHTRAHTHFSADVLINMWSNASDDDKGTCHLIFGVSTFTTVELIP